MWSSLSEAGVKLYLCLHASKYNFTIKFLFRLHARPVTLLLIKVFERFVKVKFLSDVERARTVI